MIVTESEALQLWCPFARATPTDGGFPAANRWGDSKPEQAAQCIASECMAWRWHGMAAHEELGIKYERTGYCGLAGKP